MSDLTERVALAGAGAHEELHPSFGHEGVRGVGVQGEGGWAKVQVHHSHRHQLGRHWLHLVSSLLFFTASRCSVSP